MNTDELDAFFAKAEDVLTDWRPSDDAMVARVPDGDEELPVRADSYYEQRGFGGVRMYPQRAVIVDEVGPEWLRRAFLERPPAFFPSGWVRYVWVPSVSTVEVDDCLSAGEIFQSERDETDPMQRALEARRTRNTGPGDPRRLDGRRRRRTQ